jgi:hypothetical protein
MSQARDGLPLHYSVPVDAFEARAAESTMRTVFVKFKEASASSS